ncbi:hypothetical protein V7S43_008676 [Phytophthora oleae]|uniref:Uncharacterized protein n=1 Tax=Phytophthora oleae TaxID=2107226 RepID=A0ABD3FKU1_9STRA
MDLALTAVEGLRQIYELVDTIRRQRSQNRETYMRMMQIYVELQSESVQANLTLQRTKVIEKFTFAVAMFYEHLNKYNDMHRVVRIFKWAKMEDSRLEVVDEVDRLFQMLNLATTVAVMERHAAAASNVSRLFAKLNDMHSEIRLTHDQIHAALLADKQQVRVVEKQDVVGRGLNRQAPLRSYGRAVLDKKLSIRDENDLEEPEDGFEPEDEFEPEEKTPVGSEECAAEAWIGPKTLPLIKKIELAELKQQAVNEEEEEKEPSEALNAIDEEEAVEEKEQQEEEEPIEQELEQQLAVDLEVEDEEKRRSDQERVVLNTPGKEEVVEEEEPQKKEQPIGQEPVLQVEDESKTQSDQQPVTAQHSIDDVVENQQQQEEKNINFELESVENDVDEVAAAEDQQEEDEEKIDPLAQVEMKETVDQTLSPQLSSSSLLDDSSVPLLIKLLGSGQATAQETEQALLDLIAKCVSHSNRVQVYKTKGIPVLRGVVRTSESFLAQLYALHCLSWFTFSFSKVREAEFVELQGCVREPTHSETLSLLHELQYGNEQEKEVATLRCSCLATRGDGEALRHVGVFPLLIDLLTNGTANQKLWATEALVTLASDDDENCVSMTQEGAIPPLVALLRSGTDMQKQEAAYALGNLAANNATTRAKIAREGAIPPMVEFVKAVADAQNQWAVYALGFLSLNNEENRVLIAQEGAIPPLVALLTTGTRAQQQWSAYTLGNLAYSDANRVEITKQEAIGPLIELLRSGTAMQKQRAAFALGNLACDNDVGSDFDDAILPLVDLVRVGSDTQKEDAAYTLGNLAANNEGRRVEIGRKGAIEPLVKLLKSGNDDQKQWAAFALKYLSYNNDENRVAIVKEGAIPPLAALVEGGTDEQKEQAAHALKHLTEGARYAFSAERIMTPLMGYLRAGVASQNANVAAALSSLGTVCEGVMPLFHKFVAPDSEAQRKSVSAHAEAGKKKSLLADAW